MMRVQHLRPYPKCDLFYWLHLLPGISDRSRSRGWPALDGGRADKGFPAAMRRLSRQFIALWLWLGAHPVPESAVVVEGDRGYGRRLAVTAGC
jgi:hypothetical protein